MKFETGFSLVEVIVVMFIIVLIAGVIAAFTEDIFSQSFTFYSDIDNDSLKEKIRYYLSGAILKKGVIKPNGNPLQYNPANEITKEIVHDVTNGGMAVFNYYDKYYDGTTAPLSQPVNVLDVRLVKITLMTASQTFTTQVSIRNLKDNL